MFLIMWSNLSLFLLVTAVKLSKMLHMLYGCADTAYSSMMILFKCSMKAIEHAIGSFGMNNFWDCLYIHGLVNSLKVVELTS